MKYIIFTLAAVMIATARARPGTGDQVEEQFHALLEANDEVAYDRVDLEGFTTRKARQNIRWTGYERGPTVPIGKFPNKQSCLAKCREMDYPNVLYRNGNCRCRPQLMRVGVVE